MRINKIMQQNDIKRSEKDVENKQDLPGGNRPQESGSFHVSGFVRIHDPNNKEVFVETRE